MPSIYRGHCIFFGNTIYLVDYPCLDLQGFDFGFVLSQHLKHHPLLSFQQTESKGVHWIECGR